MDNLTSARSTVDNLIESWRRRENVRISYEICQSRRGVATKKGTAVEGGEGELKRKREKISRSGDGERRIGGAPEKNAKGKERRVPGWTRK